MKNKVLKKIICVLLSLVTVLAVPLSAMALEASSSPVVYVGGIADNALYVNPNKNGATIAFDLNSSEFVGDMTNIVSGVAITLFTDVATGTTPVINGINGLMNPIACAPNGTSLDSKVGPWEYTGPMSEHTEDAIYDEDIKALINASAGKIEAKDIYYFSYDWRLDPVESAYSLREFIDYVQIKTGGAKVSVLAVGYGGIIVNSYLYECEAHAKMNVSSCVFYDTFILGNAVVSDFMKGRIARIIADEDNFMDVISTINGEHRGEAFFNFIEDDATGIIDGIFENLLGSGDVQKLFGSLFTLLFTTIFESQDGHKTVGKAYNNFALNADSVIYEAGLRDYLRNMPGLWAMVTESDFTEAIEFLFEDEFINNSLEEKIYSYREVQRATENTLKTAQANGINVTVVANYGLQLMPVTISLDHMSDGIVSVHHAAPGAVTLDNSDEAGHFVNCIGKNHNHLSPDKDIDASYCFLPENTWFIKDLPHSSMTDDTVAAFIVWLLTSKSQRNIRENKDYTQFLKYSKYAEKIVPYVTPGDDSASSRLGDVDLNGEINAADARAALRISVGLDAASKEVKILADVDENGSVQAADARAILRFSVGLIQNF